MKFPLRFHQFASDNYAGVCPEAWDAMQRANRGHVPAYGDDGWTQCASDSLRDVFETDCEVFFTFNGTAANSLALASLCQSHHSVLCHQMAHIETDECGAPEFFSNGTKLLLLTGEKGKIRPEAVGEMVERRRDIHYPKPRVLSLTQSTEMGTVYRPEELALLGQAAKKYNLRVHMDGARFANAVASLGVSPKEITWQVGVDVLCFGATKNGASVGEAVIFFDRDLAQEFDYRCKQAGQLASKMRFLSAPWVGLLEGDIWLRNAAHANAMAALLESQLRALNLPILAPREANAVFTRLSPAITEQMHARGWQFYTFIGEGGARLMCSWDTSPQDVEAFITDLKECQ